VHQDSVITIGHVWSVGRAEQGKPVTRWGRLIFYVTDVDALWNHLKDRGFDREVPRDASWGEWYFHMPDPDGHELSFARPLP